MFCTVNSCSKLLHVTWVPYPSTVCDTFLSHKLELFCAPELDRAAENYSAAITVTKVDNGTSRHARLNKHKGPYLWISTYCAYTDLFC